MKSKKNLEIGVQLGINPEHIYFHAKTGVKITRMIPGATTLTPSDTKEEKTMEKVTNVLRKLHSSNVQMGNQFKLYDLMEHYEKNAREANAQFYPQFEEAKKEVERVKSAYDELPKEETALSY